MLSRLIGPRGRIPDTEVIYAVGDIHGRDDLLSRLHTVISEDLAENTQGRQATVVYLGDYVDRGPRSKAVLDCLLDHPIGGAESVFLKGNHEDAMLRFVDAQAGGESWLTIGGGATARSYGVTVHADRRGEISVEAVRTQLNSSIPARHLEFLRNLQLTFQTGDYLFVHAGIRPGQAIDDQDEKDLLWIRGEFLRSRRRHEKIIVHGHSSGHKVVARRNRICVDTAAYATDRLSCVVIEGKSYRFLSAQL